MIYLASWSMSRCATDFVESNIGEAVTVDDD